VQTVAWAADGTTVAAASMDRCVRFWYAGTGQPQALLIAEDRQVTAVSADGHYRAAPGVEPDLVCVVQLERGQATLEPAEFAAKYRWKNAPALVKWTGK
jgi:hypothetical protein